LKRFVNLERFKDLLSVVVAGLVWFWLGVLAADD
jgi:hypothetical protein